MKKAKVLFVSQEISPYLEITDMAKLSRMLPQGVQEKGKEIRTFMPRFGSINERRNHLHEVIRLSGMNLIIDESDHPLIIKVASIQSARMQVYFIDNDEYFHRKNVFHDNKDNFYPDNDDRAIFFCRGVLETVKKLGWNPDVIHCHGWMTALIPLLIKSSYSDDPVYRNSKVVYSVYDHNLEENFNENFAKKVMMSGISADDVKELQVASVVNLNINAIRHADAVIKASNNLPVEIEAMMKKTNAIVLDYIPEEFVAAHSNLYDELLLEDSVLV